MALDVGVRGRNDRVVNVLKHLYFETICEALGYGEEIRHHGVAAPPLHEVSLTLHIGGIGRCRLPV